MLLIFDCDGVLVDTEPIQLRVMAQMVAELGGTLSEADLLAQLRGHGMQHHLRFIEEHLGRGLPPDFEATLRQRWEVAFRAELRPLPGVAETLTQLSQRKCVASNGPRAKMALTLGVTGLSRFFAPTQVYSAYDVGRWKPDPALYRHAAAQEGFAPEQCVVVEDSVAGVQAAVAAGMWVWGVAEAERMGELTAVGAHPLTNITDLPRLLPPCLPANK